MRAMRVKTLGFIGVLGEADPHGAREKFISDHVARCVA